jgi:hypothetical protein
MKGDFRESVEAETVLREKLKAAEAALDEERRKRTALKAQAELDDKRISKWIASADAAEERRLFACEQRDVAQAALAVTTAALDEERRCHDELEAERTEALDYAARVNKQRLDAETKLAQTRRALRRVMAETGTSSLAHHAARDALATYLRTTPPSTTGAAE